MKILLQICENPEGSQKISSKMPFFSQKSNHGGLDSRDQSRSRTSFVSRPVFKTCQDFLDGRDRLLFYLGRDFYNRDFLVETWLCRDFRQDCRDKSRLSRFLRFVKTFRDLSRYRHYRDFLRYFREKISTN